MNILATGEESSTDLDSFRLLVWNCAGGFHRKHSILEQFGADLAIICEVKLESLDTLGLLSNAVWIGRQAGPGAAIIGYNGWQLQHAGFDIPERWFLPAIASKGRNSVQIVSVCVQKAENYVAPTLRAIRQLEPFIGAGPTIVAGDFNQSPTTDHKYASGQRSSDTFDLMAGLGMRSAWHSLAGEQLGQETRPTHFWGSDQKPFHIDYAFVSQQLATENVEIASCENLGGMSDHAPLCIDLVIRE